MLGNHLCMVFLDTPAESADTAAIAMAASSGGTRVVPRAKSAVARAGRARATWRHDVDGRRWPVEQRRTTGGKARWPGIPPNGARSESDSDSLWRCNGQLAPARRPRFLSKLNDGDEFELGTTPARWGRVAHYTDANYDYRSVERSPESARW